MEMKAAKSAGSGFARPIRKYGPLAQNRRNGAPQGDALPEFIASHAVPEAKQYQGAPCGAPCPSLFEGQNQKLTSRDARERMRVAKRKWLFEI